MQSALEKEAANVAATKVSPKKKKAKKAAKGEEQEDSVAHRSLRQRLSAFIKVRWGNALPVIYWPALAIGGGACRSATHP